MVKPQEKQWILFIGWGEVESKKSNTWEIILLAQNVLNMS